MFNFMDMFKQAGEAMSQAPEFMADAAEQMGPPKPKMGPPAPMDSFTGPEMPEAYSHNRMEEMGAPKVAQIGEALFDSYRANKWEKANGPQGPKPEVDEMGGKIGGQQAAATPASNGAQGANAKGSGIFDGGGITKFFF